MGRTARSPRACSNISMSRGSRSTCCSAACMTTCRAAPAGSRSPSPMARCRPKPSISSPTNSWPLSASFSPERATAQLRLRGATSLRSPSWRERAIRLGRGAARKTAAARDKSRLPSPAGRDARLIPAQKTARIMCSPRPSKGRSREALRRRDEVRRLRASSQRGTRAAVELPPGPLGGPARSWLTARSAR